MAVIKHIDNIVWITKEGKEIPIKNLSDNHLDKCIQMLENNAKKFALNVRISTLSIIERKKYTRDKKLRRVLKKDIEPYFSDFDIIWEKYVDDIYWDLVYEKKKRQNILFT